MLDYIFTIRELLWSWFGNAVHLFQRVLWGCGSHLSAITKFTFAELNRNKGRNEPALDLNELNGAGMKTL